MKAAFKIFLGLMIGGLLLPACIDETELDVTGAEGTVFIDGLVGDSLQVYTIKVSESAVVGVGTEYVHPAISGATVEVVDDAGERVRFMEGERAGYYEAEMKTEPGRAYHVEIQLPNGRTITSSAAASLASPPIKKVQVEAVQSEILTSTGGSSSETRAEVRLDVDIAGATEPVLLRWRVRGEYEFQESYPGMIIPKTCYAPHTIDFNNLSLLDSRDYEGENISSEPFFDVRLDYRFRINYCFHITQYRMNERELEYWRTVEDVINVDGSFFDPPPGTVRGNLNYTDDDEDLVLGYFSVVGVSSTKAFTSSGLLGANPNPLCPPWPPQRPDECFDCLVLRGSTQDEPSYWP